MIPHFPDVGSHVLRTLFPLRNSLTSEEVRFFVRVHFCVRALVFACFSVAGALVILLVI
jgi:hypothetical protein